MEEQTLVTSQILAYRNSVAYMTEAVLQNMVNHAVNAFSMYTNDHLFKELHCQKDEKIYPRVEVLITFDGAWSQEYTADFLSAMLDELDVSVFGSKIGLIHGTTGEWLLNVTNSPARAHHIFTNFNNLTWPSQIKFKKVLTQALAYFDATWKEKHQTHTIGNLGQIIVFLAPRTHFNTQEQQTILMLIKELKAQHPDVYVLYYVSDNNAPLFRPFLLSQEDDLIRSSSISDITYALLRGTKWFYSSTCTKLLTKSNVRRARLIEVDTQVSRVLRLGPCNGNGTEGIRDQIEDYVSPRQSVIYRLHPQWRKNTKQVTVTAHNVGYGTIEFCTWNQQTNSLRKEGLYCRELTGHAETTIIDYATCNENTPCNTTHYEITGISSRKQCTEIDCRRPDYIRYIIRVENLYCSNAAYYSSEGIYTIIVITFTILSY